MTKYIGERCDDEMYTAETNLRHPVLYQLFVAAIVFLTVLWVGNMTVNLEAYEERSKAESAVLSIKNTEGILGVQNGDKVAVHKREVPCETLVHVKITHYCECEVCCGKHSDGITASGTEAKAGRTIAVDPEMIPLGSEVIIDGESYIAEDTGGAINGNRIDVYCETHEEAISRGIVYRDVVVYE